MAGDPFSPYDPIFQAAGTEWNVDPMLLKAIAMQESPKADPRAVSKTGALGLMQIMPQTAKDLGVEDPFDPVQSIYGAAKYMDQALKAEGNPEAAVLYYHGGPGWRKTYSQSTESQTYLPAIIKHFKALQAVNAPPPSTPTPTVQASQGQP